MRLPTNPQDEPKFVRICAWCPDSKQKTAEATAAGFRVSHTICPDCQARVLREMKQGDVVGLGRDALKGIGARRLIEIIPEDPTEAAPPPNTTMGTATADHDVVKLVFGPPPGPPEADDD